MAAYDCVSVPEPACVCVCVRVFVSLKSALAISLPLLLLLLLLRDKLKTNSKFMGSICIFDYLNTLHAARERQHRRVRERERGKEIKPSCSHCLGPHIHTQTHSHGW